MKEINATFWDGSSTKILHHTIVLIFCDALIARYDLFEERAEEIDWGLFSRFIFMSYLLPDVGRKKQT